MTTAAPAPAPAPAPTQHTLRVPLPPDAKYSSADITALPADSAAATGAGVGVGAGAGASAPAFLEDLRTKGYAVVPHLVPAERAASYVDGALTWLEDFGLGFKREDHTTWKTDMLPVHHKGGLYNRYCCAHEDWVWKVRCEPAVINTFAELWGTDELIVSFDAVNVTFPYGEHGRTDCEWVDPWPHQDQDPTLPVFQLAQGIFTCSECGPEDGGLCVMEGSHLLHQQFFAANGGVDASRTTHALNSRSGLVQIPGLQRGQAQIVAPAGSLILWDSRLMHWNRLPTGDRTRVAAYVCYQPRAQASEAQLRRKAEVFEKRLVATHWPALNDVRELYQGPAMRDGKPDPANRTRPVHEPEITDTLLKLAGVKAY